jgi:hypothetical protein
MTKTELKLPDALESFRPQLVDALSAAVPAQWDEEEKLIEAEQPAAVAGIVIRALHPHLRNKDIGFLFREKIEERGKITLAKASKVSGKLAFFSNLDFLVEVNFEAWKVMPREAKIALMDHELCHFDVESGETGDKNVLVSHDVEEFGAIVRRWGLWKQDLKLFAHAVRDADQIGLFEKRPSDESTITIEAAGESVTLTGAQLRRAVNATDAELRELATSAGD